MPLQPMTVTLSDGQKIEALKRCRAQYQEELETLEAELGVVLAAVAEGEFLGQYIGEQPEVVALRNRKPEAEKLEKRRQHISLIVERLEQIIPKQQDVKVPVPNGDAGRSGGGGIRRY